MFGGKDRRDPNREIGFRFRFRFVRACVRACEAANKMITSMGSPTSSQKSLPRFPAVARKGVAFLFMSAIIFFFLAGARGVVFLFMFFSRFPSVARCVAFFGPVWRFLALRVPGVSRFPWFFPWIFQKIYFLRVDPEKLKVDPEKVRVDPEKSKGPTLHF